MSTIWQRMRKEKRKALQDKFKRLLRLVRTVGHSHPDSAVRDVSTRYTITLLEYIKMAGTNPFYANHPNNKHPLPLITPKILQESNSNYHRYRKLLKQCKDLHHDE